VPRLFSIGAFAVYVYAESGNPHKVAHCHVRGKEVTTVVSIPSQVVLAGPKLPKNVRQELQARMEEVMQGWDRLNPIPDTENTNE
jgi:hypothetical protein